MFEAEDGQEVVHFAGTWFRVGTRLRQRCGWCGAVLIDVDLANIGRPTEDLADIDPDDPREGYPTWPETQLVAHDGAVWWLVEFDPATDTLPGNCCSSIDPEITAS